MNNKSHKTTHSEGSWDEERPIRPLNSFNERSRRAAWRIMRAALESVEPSDAVRRHFHRSGNTLSLATSKDIFVTYDLSGYDRVLVVGAGKAGVPMSVAASRELGEWLTGGLVITKYGYRSNEFTDTGPIEIVEAGHPLPDRAGIEATRRIVEMLISATKRDLVIILLSGGGSSLMTSPAGEITLEDSQALMRELLACGATIGETNVVRKHISRIKGGQLAKMAEPASLISLILSDVVGDPLEVVASGPTVADTSTFADAWAVLKGYRLLDTIPISVKAHLQEGVEGRIPETPKPCDPAFDNGRNVVVGSNRIAAMAALTEASRLLFDPVLLTTFMEGEAREVGKVVAGLAKGILRGEAVSRHGKIVRLPACLILGGETTVTIRGAGAGGRNQEMALAAGLALDGWGDVLVACLATDGGDGPTEAAGAFADGTTVQRAKALGMNPADYLVGNDSNSFFGQLGDLIVTGPTRTNVNDLVVVLVGVTPSGSGFAHRSLPCTSSRQQQRFHQEKGG